MISLEKSWVPKVLKVLIGNINLNNAIFTYLFDRFSLTIIGIKVEWYETVAVKKITHLLSASMLTNLPTMENIQKLLQNSNMNIVNGNNAFTRCSFEFDAR